MTATPNMSLRGGRSPTKQSQPKERYFYGDKMIKEENIKKFSEQCKNIFSQIERDVIGQKNVVEGVVIAMIAGGNVLLEGVPGVGKTRLVRSLGRVFNLPFSRIQFTPDLMPAERRAGQHRIQFPTRSRIQQHNPCRRDKPRHSQNAVRAFGSHAGTHRNGNGRIAQARRTVFRARHSKPC